MNEICTDNRFKIIEKVKDHLIEATNITQKELEVVDSILFRLWLLRYFDNVEVEENEQLEELIEKMKCCFNCKHYKVGETTCLKGKPHNSGGCVKDWELAE